MVKVVSIKFKDGGKVYYFDPLDISFEKGDGVVVETAKGQEFAIVYAPVSEVEESQVVLPLRPVVRKATEADLKQVKLLEEKRVEAIKTAREKIAERGLNMKPIGCEFAFDGSKVTIYFTAPERVDFRELIRDLSSAFHMRIELRQINIREEIKLLGGYGPCGRECCCVRTFGDFSKVSVKMAKSQGLSLNPEKISGLCGRLMCCLAYENDYYAEACKCVPKIGSTAESTEGVGTVINVNMLNMTVKLRIENGEAVTFREFPVDKIRFKRGNVVMGNLDLTEDKKEEEADEEQTTALSVQSDTERRQGGKKPAGEKRQGSPKNYNREKGQSGNRGKGERQGKPQGERQRQNNNRGGRQNNNPREENQNAEGGASDEGAASNPTGQNGKKYFKRRKHNDKPKNNA